MLFSKIKRKHFNVLALHHAEAILKVDMPSAVDELESILMGIRVPVEELVRGGGGEGELTQRMRRCFTDEYGWGKHSFEIKKIIDGKERESITHEIDHVKTFNKSTFALEIEWNNKDPFFDRDLDNFKRLHADGAISIGAIITRGVTLQDGMCEMITDFARDNNINSIEKIREYYSPTVRQIELIRKSAESKSSFEEGWAHAFVSDKFGKATTHWEKLEERVRRGVGNPCPLLLIGIPRDVVEEGGG